VREALEAHVRDRQMMVVLDNCEHLLEACAELARALLAAGQGVRILATSREPLRIAGEATYPIAGLPVPGSRSQDMHGAVAASEAARLFLERAAAARPDFALTADNARAIAAICRSLDGIPLAIELAAARIRMLPVDEIAARMRDRFRLLKGGDPTAQPRQRTLRSLIDWSYDLLPPAEQALFRRLSVFAGGWTLESAEAVCGGGDGDDGARRDDGVLDLLGRLVEKSLVALDDEQNRYHLLETVREYAQERLEEAGEQDNASECHLAHYLALVERAKPHLMGPEQGGWFALLDSERENVLRAHAWAQGSAAAGESDLRLVGEMKYYWINRGLLELGHRAMVEALEHPGARSQTPRMRGLFQVGQLRYTMGLYAEARACLEEGLAIARQLEFPRGISSLLQPLGMAATAQGDFRVARTYLEEALVLAQAQGEKHQLAGAYNALAQLDRAEGHPERTPPLYGEVVRLLRETGDIESAAIGQLNLAMISIIRGQAEEGRALILEALATGSRTQSRPVVKSVLEVCAGLAALRRDWTATARFYGAAEAQARETGARRDPADEAFLAPRVELARAALPADAFQQAVSAGRALTYEQAVAESGAWLRDLEAVVASEKPTVTSR
jgi:non-specific serine/threonine protein kinase